MSFEYVAKRYKKHLYLFLSCVFTIFDFILLFAFFYCPLLINAILNANLIFTNKRLTILLGTSIFSRNMCCAWFIKKTKQEKNLNTMEEFNDQQSLFITFCFISKFNNIHVL